MKNADFIIAGDLHIDNRIPKCRTDNYVEALWKKIEFIDNLSLEHDCPVITPGDIFERAKMPQYIEGMTIQKTPPVICTPGNHDLPSKNIEHYLNSSLSVVDLGREDWDVLTPDKPFIIGENVLIEGFWWGADLKGPAKKKRKGGIRKIAVLHRLVWTQDKPWKDCSADSAHKLISKLPEYDLIVTGHHHKGFIVKYKKQILINCGSLTRQEADQIDHKPFVVLYDVANHEIEKVEIPIKKGVVSREHIEKKQEEEKRHKTYIRRLQQDIGAHLSFEKNLEPVMPKLRKPVADIITESMEADNDTE